MAIIYPINLPPAPAPRRFSVLETSASAMTQSPWSFAQQAQLNQGQMWAFSVDLPPMNDDQARDWAGVIAQLNGRFGTFLFGDPRWKTPRGNWEGAVVNGAGQAGQTLAVSGLVAGALLRAGDYFQLGAGADAKLHKCVKDVVATGGGEASLDIWPRLRTAPSNGASLITASPKGVFRLGSGGVSRSFEPFRHGFSFEMGEAL